MLVLGAERDGTSWASLVIANILDSSLAFHGEDAVWKAGKELDDDPLR